MISGHQWIISGNQYMISGDQIKINGKLVLEMGFDQKFKVKKLLKEKGFYINKVLKDLSNNDRCIISTKI